MSIIYTILAGYQYQRILPLNDLADAEKADDLKQSPGR